MLYTDLLLGVQKWRWGLLDDVQELEKIANEYEKEEKLKYENLLGKQINEYIMYENFFDKGMPMPMMMDDGGDM